jgi:hypothetical protein
MTTLFARRTLLQQKVVMPAKAGHPVRLGPFDSIAGVYGILDRPVK